MNKTLSASKNIFKFNHFLSLAFLGVSSIVLIALQIKHFGWVFLGIGCLITVLFCSGQFRRDIILVYIAIVLLGIAPISTDVSWRHFFLMMPPIILAIAIPYFISRYVNKDYTVRFRFHHERNWYKKEIFYILFAATVTYLLWPFIFRETGSYQNWKVEIESGYLIRFLIAMFIIGIWDELFFISTVFQLLRKHFSFIVANFTQSIIFTSFLYEMGFRGWSFLVIFIFALSQGQVFKKTKSLFYLISIHLTVDFILYLALIHAFYPDQMPIFVIK